MRTKPYYPYISGLKGFSCFCVMLGHFAGIIKYINEATFNYAPFVNFCNSRLGYIFQESFWLYLFFLASGFLLAQSEIMDFPRLCLKIINRFFRLAIPIFFSCGIIFLLFLIIPHQNQNTNTLFINTWFQDAYATPLSILDIFVSPFDVLLRNICIFNSPYWVLRNMFIASVIIYVWQYLRTRWIKLPILRFAGELLLLYLVKYRYSDIVFACLIGMCFSLYYSDVRKYIPVSKIWSKLLMFLLLVVSFRTSKTFFFAILLYAVPYFSFINNMFSSVALQFLGTNSWGIYSFHWPLVCSFGASCMLFLHKLLPIWWTLLLSIFCTLIITLLLSHAYTITLEKIAAKWTKRITGFCANTIHMLFHGAFAHF